MEIVHSGTLFSVKQLFLCTYALIGITFSLYCQQHFYHRLADSALVLSYQSVTYDPSYFSIPYPNGDVPADKGVCTDVIIRAYRKVGIDLQQLVHEDMTAHFSSYPQKWGLRRPDPNIDHRRVPNLMTFFERQGASRIISTCAEDYLPGDVVCWNLKGGMTHMGLITHQLSSDGERHLVIHNIGRGQVVEDCLFDVKIIGHYRFGAKRGITP